MILIYILRGLEWPHHAEPECSCDLCVGGKEGW